MSPKILQKIQERPVMAVVIVGLVGVVIWWNMGKPVPVKREVRKVSANVTGVDVERVSVERGLLDLQKQNETLRNELRQQSQDLKRASQEAESLGKRTQEQTIAQEQRFEAAMKQLQQARVSQPPAREAAPPKKSVSAPARPVLLPEQQAKVAPRQSSDLETVKFKKSTSGLFSQTPLVSADHLNTAHIPYGSRGPGRIVTGVFASSRANSALPVLLTLSRPFQGPWHLGGPGRNAQETEVPIAGCVFLGKAEAELVSQRVHIQLEKIACVFPDQSTFEREAKGYVVGEDGSLGVPGKLESREGAFVAQAALAAAMKGLADAATLAKRTVVTPFGGAINTQQGDPGSLLGFGALGRTSELLATRFLENAQRYLPVIWVESGVPVTMVLQEGLGLEGFPTKALIYAGGK